MAITTYTELQTAIGNYLARSDLTAYIPDFITQAENRLNRRLRVREMENQATSSLTAGALALPSNYIEWIGATWVGATRSANLRYVELNSEEWRFRYRPNGDPTMFTILASNVVIQPTATGNLTLYYYNKIPSLTNSTTTNWLLTKYPDIYLNASLAEAYIFQKDEARAGQFIALMEADIGTQIAEADSNKVARRPTRQADVEAIALTRNQMTGPP